MRGDKHTPPGRVDKTLMGYVKCQLLNSNISQDSTAKHLTCGRILIIGLLQINF